MTKDLKKPKWTNLPEFASDKVGGKIIFCTDEFFAAAERMIKFNEPESKKHILTKSGVWMDGWESRRKRIEGHDWCILKLPVSCNIKGIVIDTCHFLGNFTPSVSIQAAENPDLTKMPKYKSKMGNFSSKEEIDYVDKLCGGWKTIVSDTKLGAGNEATRFTYVSLNSKNNWTHLRINMLPDGGIARVRVHGIPKIPKLQKNKLVNLSSMFNGARVIYFNDSFFSHANNLLVPGKSKNMHDGWETARKLNRPKTLKVNKNNLLVPYGKDWCVIMLAAPAVIEQVEVDTTHFKGNPPESFTLEGCFDKNYETNRAKDKYLYTNKECNKLGEWKKIKSQTKVKANSNNVFKIDNKNKFTHVRLSIIPDGGVSRLRIKGKIVN